MSQRLQHTKSVRAENIKSRIGLLLVGAFMLSYGLLELRADGLFVYFNSRGLPHYPGGVIALGIFLIVIAFVPIGKWVKRLASTKPRRKIRSRRFTKL